MEREKQTGIQVARAVAALSIVYFHSWVALVRFPKDTAYPIPFLTQFGWFAVDLFFAISGFVICLVVSRETFNIRSFLIKRVFRLYPLWLVMLTTFAVTASIWRGLQPRETFGFFLYSTTLLPTNGFPFYDIGWSLQHEMVFYLIAAFLVPAFGLIGLATFLAASTLAFNTIELPWYLGTLAQYHGEFLAGVLAFMARRQLARFGFFIPAAIGIVLLYHATFHLGRQWFPIALFFLITAFANMADRKSLKVLARIGDASFSIYLIHPIVFLVASAAVSRISLPIWSEEPIRFGCFVAIIIAARISWTYFEKPMIALGNRLVASHAKPSPSPKGLAPAVEGQP
jgi:exopolysaccharide production protein ExoZ